MNLKHLKTVLFIFASFSLVSLQTKAQEAWSLQKCIEYALENNISVKQNELNAELSKENYNQSIANMAPSLNAGASHSYNWGQRIDPFTNTFATNRVRSNNLYISSQVTLFSGLQLQNTLKQNSLNYLAGKYDVEKMKNDIVLNVATAYLNVLFAQELLGVANTQKSITETQVERTQKLVDAGTLALGSLLDLQAQLASDELNIVNTENQLAIALLSLSQIMNVKTTETFSIVKPQMEMPANPVLAENPEQIYQFAVDNQPSIKSAETKILSAEKGIKIAKGSAYPSLTLSGSVGSGYSGLSQKVVGFEPGTPSIIGYTPDTIPVYSISSSVVPITERTPFGEQLKNNVNENLGFNLNIPIFNGWQSHNSISRAKIAKQNAEYTLELNEQNLRKTIEQAHVDAQSALKQYYATKKSVDALSQAFEYADKRFNVGALNSTDYNTAKNRLNNAQSDLLRNKFNFIFKSKVLDFYMGKPITL
jgi:outer membrane protein